MMSNKLNNFRHLLGVSFLVAMFLGGPIAQSSETIPRAMLVDMARSQFTVLCESEVFASCMGFSTKSCLDLSNTAIKQCLLPLPEEIPLEDLENSALESCPKTVYADAGFTEEKAGICFDKAMESEQ